MYIKTSKTHVQTLHNDDLMPDDYTVEFNSNGVAQVTDEVGEALISEYDSITEYQQ